jgi:hypothetical protein
MIAWDAALNMAESPTQTLFGQGLDFKVIPVAGQWWRTQVLDSSFVSAYIQAGLIGVVVTAVLVIYTATQALKNASPANHLWLALLVYIVGTSVFETGLIDTSPTFIVFMVVSMGAATRAHLGSFSGGNHFHARV